MFNFFKMNKKEIVTLFISISIVIFLLIVFILMFISIPICKIVGYIVGGLTIGWILFLSVILFYGIVGGTLDDLREKSSDPKIRAKSKGRGSGDSGWYDGPA